MLVLAPGAIAATENGDAGDLRATAQDLGDDAPTVIWGTFTSGADVDVYRLCLTDGTSFSASTVGATTLDTQMFLFDSGGLGVYANDDASGSRGSLLPAGHRFSPDTGGEYFLAIGSYNRDPQSVRGEIFQDSYNRFVYPDGVIPATGFGAGEPLIGWDGRAPGGPGAYRIGLTGTRACVPPDTTAPAVDLRSPADGAVVPRGAAVEVDFSCSDEGGSGIASCAGSVPDGSLLDTSTLGAVAVTVTARDAAGNETVVTNTATVVDETAPSISIGSPADGAVFVMGEEVVADYACADEPGGSGLAKCEGTVPDGAAVDTSRLGRRGFTVEATDAAGNASSQTVHYTVVDRTGPAIDIVTPADGAVYGLGQQVPADYSCSDDAGGSGVAHCYGTVPDGAPVDTSSAGSKSFTVNAVDAAGNPSSRTVAYTVADTAGPSIEVAAPVDGAGYSVGQAVHADYSCSDEAGGSGVASCVGTVPDGEQIDTSRAGAHTFVVNATDAAGNTSSRTVTYRVGYSFSGFFWPVQDPPKLNRWKAGLPVPIRFSLDGFRGSRPEAEGYPRSVRCGGGGAELAPATPWRRSAFDYDRRRDQYWMLWKTERKWAGSCREFVLMLDDGSVHTAKFQFSKR